MLPCCASMVLQVVQLSAATSHAGFWGQPGSSSRGTAANYGFSALLADMLAPGHTIVLQERLQDGQQQQQGTGRPPAGRGAGKAARGGRGGGGRGRQGGSAPTAAAGTGGDGQPAVLLHVHLPELQEMQQDVRAAEEQVVAAAAAALDGVAGTFLGSYGVFRSLVAAVADLDVLAGFAQVSLSCSGPTAGRCIALEGFIGCLECISAAAVVKRMGWLLFRHPLQVSVLWCVACAGGVPRRCAPRLLLLSPTICSSGSKQQQQPPRDCCACPSAAAGWAVAPAAGQQQRRRLCCAQ